MKVSKEFRIKLFCYTYFCVRGEKKDFSFNLKLRTVFLETENNTPKIYNYKKILVKMKQKKIDLETCLFLFRDNDDEPRKEPNLYRKSNFSRKPFLTFFFAFSDERMTDIFQEFTYCKK